jgi:hypothetical protein
MQAIRYYPVQSGKQKTQIDIDAIYAEAKSKFGDTLNKLSE